MNFMVLMIDSQIAGISGDMILASLVDLGANKSKIIESIHIAESYLENSTIKNIDFKHIKKNGKQATELILEIEENVHEREASEIKNCILNASEKIGLTMSARNFALNTVETLISAEAKVHGESKESVHFHEASNIDTVIDKIMSRTIFCIN